MSQDITYIKVSRRLRRYLKHKARKDESYNDFIIRLLIENGYDIEEMKEWGVDVEKVLRNMR